MSLGKTTWNSLETSMWDPPKTRVSYHLHGKKQKFWLQNQMVCTLLFKLGSFRRNIWTVFWGDAIFPPFSVGYPSCSGSPSHRVKFYGFMFMHKISTQVVCVNGKHPDFKATAIHQLSETSIPFAYLSNTATNLSMPLLNSASPFSIHHVGIRWDCLTCRLSSTRSCSAKWSEISADSLCLCEKFGRVPRQWTLYCKQTVLSHTCSILVKSPEPQVV